MSGFKTELHCHTKTSSVCGRVEEKDLVKAYIDAGYSTMVITDHFGARHVDKCGEENMVEHFLKGFRRAKEAGKGRIHVILGMEISLLPYPDNDYLVYGDVESALRKQPDLYQMDLPSFCDFAHKNQLVVYQAHPFRDKITIVDPMPLDGIEVYNSHPRHDSRNCIAAEWAALFQKKAIAGSDAHRPQDIARSGILSKSKITDVKDLLSVLEIEEYAFIQ